MNEGVIIIGKGGFVHLYIQAGRAEWGSLYFLAVGEEVRKGYGMG